MSQTRHILQYAALPIELSSPQGEELDSNQQHADPQSSVLYMSIRVDNGMRARDYTVAGCRITAILYPHVRVFWRLGTPSLAASVEESNLSSAIYCLGFRSLNRMINADYCELAVCKGDTFNFRSKSYATGLYPWRPYSELRIGTPHMESNHLFQFTTGEELHSSLRFSSVMVHFSVRGDNHKTPYVCTLSLPSRSD